MKRVLEENGRIARYNGIRRFDYPPLSLSAVKSIGTYFRDTVVFDSTPRSIIRQRLSGPDDGG